VKGDMYVGRYRIRQPGSDGWTRKAVYIGPRREMTKPEARRKLRQILDQLGVNQDTNLMRSIQTAPSETFKQRVDWWEKNKLIYLQPSSCNMPGVVKKHMIPVFGDLSIDLIDERRVQEWVSKLHISGKLSPKSIENTWKILRIILGKKHVSGWSIVLPRKTKKEQRYITPEEASKIIDAAEGQFRPLFALQFATGMRHGEIAGLHVEDLDFDKSVIHIRRGTFKKIETDTKTAAGRRDVDVDPAVMKVVKEFIGDRKEGRIFMSRNGTPLVHSNINRYVLKPICKRIGIPKATTHAWRHGRISILQQNRVPGDLIKQWVGHTNLQTTSNYTHFPADYKQQIVSELAGKKE